MMKAITKIKKQKKNGFSLIEILVAMAIFGFLVYVISSILLVILNTVFQINQRQLLRSNLEGIISSVTQDVQFASNVGDCSPKNAPNTCITMDVPSSTDTVNGIGTDIKNESIFYDTSGALPRITKSVILNGGSPNVYYLSPQNINITNATMAIQQGNILFTVTGQVVVDKKNTNAATVSLTLSSIIQYNR